MGASEPLFHLIDLPFPLITWCQNWSSRQDAVCGQSVNNKPTVVEREVFYFLATLSFADWEQLEKSWLGAAPSWYTASERFAIFLFYLSRDLQGG